MALPATASLSEVWSCPGCGLELAAPSVRPEDLRCLPCQTAAREERGAVRSRRSRLFELAEVPRQYWQRFQELESWPRHNTPIDAAKSAVELNDWWAGPYSTLLLAGPVGIGKSMMAAELLWYALSVGSGRGLWVRAADFVAGMFARRGPEAAAYARRYAQVEDLVLDDLGRGYSAPSAVEVVGNLIATRTDATTLRHTLLTSNLSLVDLHRSDPATTDRLTAGLIVKMTGKSRR